MEPLRFTFFIWKLRYKGLKTILLLSSKGVNIPPYCNDCGGLLETDLHSFQDCPAAIAMWQHLVSPRHFVQFYGHSKALHGWIGIYLKGEIPFA